MWYRYSSHLLISALHLLCITGGQCVVVVTSVGENAVLPCDAGNITDPTMPILWSRTDLPPRQYVHLQRNGKAVPRHQNVSYVGRTSIFRAEVKKGNMSLKLSRVRPSDEGIYICNLPDINKESTVQLIVGSPEVQVYAEESMNPSSIILHCLATGSLPNDVTLDITRDGKVVDQLDGLQSTDVQPNDDGTSQVKKQVEILKSDPAKYSCELIHRASNLIKVLDWDLSELAEDSGQNMAGIVAGVVVLLPLLVGVLAAGIVNMKKRKGSSEMLTPDSAPGSSAGSTPESTRLFRYNKEIGDNREDGD